MGLGRIVKALSGFYYVENEHGIYQCRGRGNFRKRKITPLVGDWVEFDAENHTDGYVLEVQSRTNELIRPPIANVDQAILVFSTEEPSFSPLLLDKFLVHVEANNIDPVICMSKIDLLEEEKEKEIQTYEEVYRQLDYEVVSTSIYVEETIQALRPYLINKISVFAGQSGVGKSSLLNALKPGINIETAPISKALGRGKHTTRHVELIPIEEGGYVADTPGFSSLDFQGIEAEDLSLCFPEMREHMKDCKFRGCIHENEPKCAVKTAVDNGEIAAFRYNHYLQFLDEIKSQKRRY
ncbi:ribosome small subunit-dependent GTPase A [Evansella sp. AB-P1]|uniref:ribosome small subunit-dependent GTPase A n=1 Tax=Evansella sp. AB-P1 TaxID=3037653 RepID=UPI00241D3635|nr:ribosome small subunit-dependent GTPase A [Evansella sp. AB-P1]MDG5788241.1 ribosome small subunit-dependent GTPase A [Evansella sp. AB-P1]